MKQSLHHLLRKLQKHAIDKCAPQCLVFKVYASTTGTVSLMGMGHLSISQENNLQKEKFHSLILLFIKKYLNYNVETKYA